jgi:cytidylate kinase
MGLWTISAQAGTGAPAIAGALASRAGVDLVDRKRLLALAHEMDPDVDETSDLEARLGGRLNTFALSLALSSGSPVALRELRLRQALPQLGRAVLREAARRPAVIVAPGAFAALRDQPNAVHVRLRAPFAWRVAAYQRQEVVDRRCAEKAVRHDDEQRRAWVRALHHVDLDDLTQFTLVVDVSRLSTERVVDLLLAACAARATAEV